jgi:hypothetical protein
LQQAAFAHNLHEDSSHLFNSYGIGMHCLVTLDLLFPYKGQLLNTAVRKVLQMNPKDSDPKELSVAQGTATVALWITVPNYFCTTQQNCSFVSVLLACPDSNPLIFGDFCNKILYMTELEKN